ncbi:MAG: pyridine nucleotide-disulfide oxidoreductase, partial [Actinomycetota bacterium]
AGLINDGIACAGPHDMGIATDADTGQLIDSRGRLVADLYAIGTLRRGTLWESTAVPEIRVEAQRLAALVSTMRDS